MTIQMLNFDTPVSAPRVSRTGVSETFKTRPLTGTDPVQFKVVPEGRSHLLQNGQWDWRNMLDFISQELSLRFGHPPVDRAKGSGVCKSFIKRWGSGNAEMISRYVIESLDGRWLKQQVQIGNFSKKSDPYFAEAIAIKLGIEIPSK